MSRQPARVFLLAAAASVGVALVSCGDDDFRDAYQQCLTTPGCIADGGATPQDGGGDGGATDSGTGGPDAGADAGTLTGFSMVFLTPPLAEVSGACIGPIRVRLEDEDDATPASEYALNVSASVPVLLSTNSACSNEGVRGPFAVQPDGMLQLWFRTSAAGSIRFTASLDTDPSLTATQTWPIRPMVTRGTCTMGTTADACESRLDVLLNRNRLLLFFQATHGSEGGLSSVVGCSLGEAAGSTYVSCRRSGTMSTSTAVNVAFQVVEFARGVTVQHLSPGGFSCSQASSTGSDFAVPFPVDPNNTFLVHSHSQGTASGPLTGADFRRVSLTAADTVTVRHGIPPGFCSAEGIQLAQFSGARVFRGTSLMPQSSNGVVTSVGPPDLDLSRSFLLYSVITPATDLTPTVCSTQIKGTLDDTGLEVVFERGVGTFVCSNTPVEISWEVIELPAGSKAQQVELGVQDGVATGSVPLNAGFTYDLNRTIAFAGGQFNGQAMGNGVYTGNDLVGTALGRFELLDGDTLQVTRDRTNNSAVWTGYVVQFNP